jgi:hypothetical protein
MVGVPGRFMDASFIPIQLLDGYTLLCMTNQNQMQK